MAAKASTPPASPEDLEGATFTTLAEGVGQAQELAAAARESASTALSVTELQGKDITTLKREQTALATMLNGLKENGESVRPSKISNLLSRLEKLEQQVQGPGGLLTGDETTGKTFESMRTELDQLKQKAETLAATFEGYDTPVTVETVMSEIKQLRDHVDAVSRNPVGLDTVSSDIRASLAAYVDERMETVVSLIERLTQRVSAPAAFTPSEVTVGGNVRVKVVELMREVDHIAKTKTASGGGMNYKFRGIDDAQNAVGNAMRKIGLLLQPEVISWEYDQEAVSGFDNKDRPKTTLWSTSRLTMRYTFVSPEDGSTFSFTMIGEGRDAGDKSGSKAASMACKYGLFQALMVPLEVDESDGQNPVMESYPQVQRPTPGARVNSGEITPAQAVQEYTEQVKPGGYDAASDPSAMAGAAAPDEDTLMQKAAQAAMYVRQAQAQAPNLALSALKNAKRKAADLGIGAYVVDGVPLDTLINAALQNVMGVIENRATPEAQGLTRAAQQAGEGVRAAAPEEPPPGYQRTQQAYEDALTVVADGTASDDLIDKAMAVIHAWESK